MVYGEAAECVFELALGLLCKFDSKTVSWWQQVPGLLNHSNQTIRSRRPRQSETKQGSPSEWMVES